MARLSTVVERYRVCGTDDPAAPLARGAISLVYQGSLHMEVVTIRGNGDVEQSGGNIPPELSLPDNGVAPIFEREVRRHSHLGGRRHAPEFPVSRPEGELASGVGRRCRQVLDP